MFLNDFAQLSSRAFGSDSQCYRLIGLLLFFCLFSVVAMIVSAKMFLVLLIQMLAWVWYQFCYSNCKQTSFVWVVTKTLFHEISWVYARNFLHITFKIFVILRIQNIFVLSIFWLHFIEQKIYLYNRIL